MSFQDSDIDHKEPDRGGGPMWAWIAGICVLILIVFVLIGGMMRPSDTGKKGETTVSSRYVG